MFAGVVADGRDRNNRVPGLGAIGSGWSPSNDGRKRSGCAGCRGGSQVRLTSRASTSAPSCASSYYFFSSTTGTKNDIAVLRSYWQRTPRMGIIVKRFLVLLSAAIVETTLVAISATGLVKAIRWTPKAAVDARAYLGSSAAMDTVSWPVATTGQLVCPPG